MTTQNLLFPPQPPMQPTATPTFQPGLAQCRKHPESGRAANGECWQCLNERLRRKILGGGR